jgi:hypothetical protein
VVLNTGQSQGILLSLSREAFDMMRTNTKTKYPKHRIIVLVLDHFQLKT